MPGILDGAHEAFDEMGDSSKCRVFNTALYLRNSYTAAVQVMGNGKSWEYAVEQAIDSLSAIGVETYHRSETIKEFHRQFRKYELFEIKSSTKSVTYVKLFAIFPEANNMLLCWAQKNLQTLNSETARQYLMAHYGARLSLLVLVLVIHHLDSVAELDVLALVPLSPWYRYR
jgi:hypothetical protein